MNSTHNQTTDAAIKQLFNKFSPNEPGCAYIASFDDGVTQQKQFFISHQSLNNSQHLPSCY